LMLSVAPQLSTDQVRDVLRTSALDLGAPGRDDAYGYGRIRPVEALAEAQRVAAVSQLLTATPRVGRVVLDWVWPGGLTPPARHDLYIDGKLAATLPPHVTTWEDVGREGGLPTSYQVRMLTAGPSGLVVAAQTGVVRSAPLRSAAGQGQGYWVLTDRGRLLSFGNVGFHGYAAASGAAIIAGASSPTGRGYWVARANGAVERFGDAGSFGSVSHLPLNRPIVAMTPTADGGGYYLVASDGGVFALGNARFHGSTGALRLVAPVTDVTLDSDGVGYWLGAADGGVFSFAAPFRGSMGGRALNMAVNSLTGTPGGYVLMGRDGGIFSFGSGFYGSLPGSMPHTVPGAAPTAIRIDGVRQGGGYLVVTTDGRVMAYGDAPFYGSATALLQPGEIAVDLLVSPQA
ncbi:MAG TPA: hypothetical protein VMM13_07225, partial [Euzebya sp.]|nr:hypothetical protein [Euzebya sp.]